MAVEDSVAQDQLRAFIERIERMEEEKAAIAADIKEIYAEAKGNGFSTPIIREIVKLRKMDANDRMEKEALLELYMSALGMTVAPRDDDPRPTRRQPSQEHRAAPLDMGRAPSITEQPSNMQKVHDAAEIQPTQAAGSDLTVSSSLGQVAPHPEAKASTDGGATEQAMEGPADSVTGDASRASVGAGSDASIQSEKANFSAAKDKNIAGSSNGRTAEFDSANAGSTPAPVTSSQADKSVEASASTAPASFADRMRQLRPNCQHPEKCGGHGRQHCWPCRKALEQAGAA